MATIDLNTIKQASVHDGLLEVIILFKQIGDKTYKLLDEEELLQYPKGKRKLEEMGEIINGFEDYLAEMMGLVFLDRANEIITKQLEK